MVVPSAITDAASLLEALDDRPRDEVEAKAFDAAVWAAIGAVGAILVTDLSGFTRVTKQRGILQFLTIFRRCQVVCLPLIEQHKGVLLKQEADDFIVFFDDATDALACAVAMLKSMATLNKTMPEQDHISMCIGLEYGALLRLDDDAFGDTVNVAFKLGEDLATADEILIGNHAFERLRERSMDLSELVVSEPRSLDAGNVALQHRSIKLR